MSSFHQLDQYGSASFFKLHDLNGDYHLSRAELENFYSFHGKGDQEFARAVVTRLLARYDQNGDERLSELEYQAAKQDPNAAGDLGLEDLKEKKNQRNQRKEEMKENRPDPGFVKGLFSHGRHRGGPAGGAAWGNKGPQVANTNTGGRNHLNSVKNPAAAGANSASASAAAAAAAAAAAELRKPQSPPPQPEAPENRIPSKYRRAEM